MENEMVGPCCKKLLPASVESMERVICSCGESYSPQVIYEYNKMLSEHNEMLSILRGWRDVVNGKALIKCADGEGPFVADLCRRGISILAKSTIKGGQSWN